MWNFLLFNIDSENPQTKESILTINDVAIKNQIISKPKFINDIVYEKCRLIVKNGCKIKIYYINIILFLKNIKSGLTKKLFSCKI